MSKRFEARADTPRTEQVSCRLSKEEAEQLDCVVTVLDVTRSEYLRRVLLTSTFGDVIINPVFDQNSTEKILAQLGKIGSNLNQIARHLNQRHPVEQQMLERIDNCIKELCLETMTLHQLSEKRA